MALITFTTGNQLPAADLNTNFATVGPTVKTFSPFPPIITVGSSERSIIIANNTTAYFWAFNLYASIVVNQVAFAAQFSVTGSTIDIAIYSENGQTKVIGDITTSNISANGVKETAVSAVTLTPGNYYIGMVVNTAGASLVGFLGMDVMTVFWARLSGYALTSKPKLAGTKTVTAGTLPATFSPVTDLTDMGVSGGAWLPFRLDN